MDEHSDSIRHFVTRSICQRITARRKWNLKCLISAREPQRNQPDCATAEFCRHELQASMRKVSPEACRKRRPTV